MALPFKIGEADETSPQTWLITDEQEARALELEAADEHKRAGRIRKCARADKRSIYYPCGDRMCPACGAVKAADYKRRVGHRVREMTATPIFLTFTCPVPFEGGPRIGIKLLRSAMTKLRRRRSFNGVRAGCGVIEPKLSNDVKWWAVHAHLLIDADEIDVERVEADWRELTGNGKVLVSPDRGLHVAHRPGAIWYVAKATSWSPLPGALPAAAFKLLVGRDHGVHGAQLLIDWGPSTARGRTHGSSRARAGAPAHRSASRGACDHVVMVAATTNVVQLDRARRRRKIEPERERRAICDPSAALPLFPRSIYELHAACPPSQVGSGLTTPHALASIGVVPYGFTDAEWSAAKTEITKILADVAKRRGTIAYSQLTGRMKSIRVEPDSTALGHLLGDVSVAEDAAGRGMLSVLVVHKTGDMQPGPGFYTLAAELGRDTRDKTKCWVSELNAVYAAWR